MAIKQDEEFRSKVEELYRQGLSDGKIARAMNERVNRVHWYRYYIMKLPAHQTKRVYNDEQSKLKGYIIRGIKSSAKRRGLEFNLSHEDIELVSHCPLLGLELSYKNFLGKTDSNSSNFATVDRKDNSKGYVKGNVWMLSRLANNMKNEASPEQLKLFCQNVMKNMI